jgi:CheY-like chemotaxis protein
MNKSNSGPSILIVEDNRVQQLVMRVLCEKFGFSAYVVSSGSQAIQAVKTCNGCYDAILMDWTMPVMSGADTTFGIRAIEAPTGVRTPIIAVTANAMPGDREKCLAAGMDDYLPKPFTPDEFRAMLLRWTYHAGTPNLKLWPSYKGQSRDDGSKMATP